MITYPCLNLSQTLLTSRLRVFIRDLFGYRSFGITFRWWHDVLQNGRQDPAKSRGASAVINCYFWSQRCGAGMYWFRAMTKLKETLHAWKCQTWDFHSFLMFSKCCCRFVWLWYSSQYSNNMIPGNSIRHAYVNKFNHVFSPQTPARVDISQPITYVISGINPVYAVSV